MDKNVKFEDLSQEEKNKIVEKIDKQIAINEAKKEIYNKLDKEALDNEVKKIDRQIEINKRKEEICNKLAEEFNRK